LAALVAAAVSAWLVAYAFAGFPTWMATALEVSAAAVTLVMVFIIQHGQRRQEQATHLKLDELVRASDGDDVVAEIEHASDEELQHQRARRSIG